jgi:hypothetical protein
MPTIRHVTTILSLVLLGRLLAGGLQPVQGDADHPEVINLHPDGPQPPRLEVAVGTTVLWVSHLAPTKLVVATISFPVGATRGADHHGRRGV